jgi:hypothetical protein
MFCLNLREEKEVPWWAFQMVFAYIFAIFIAVAPSIMLWIDTNAKDRGEKYAVEGVKAFCVLGLAHGFFKWHFKKEFVEAFRSAAST